MELNLYANLTPYIAFFFVFSALYTAIYDITSRRRKIVAEFLPNWQKCGGKTAKVRLGSECSTGKSETAAKRRLLRRSARLAFAYLHCRKDNVKLKRVLVAPSVYVSFAELNFTILFQSISPEDKQ